MSAEDNFLSKARARAVVPTAERPTMPSGSPLLDRVVVKPIEPSRKTAGGLILAGTSVKAERAMTTVGQIVSLGSQAFSAKVDGMDYSADRPRVGEGAWVLYRKHAGQPIRIRLGADEKLDADDQVIFQIMEDRDILYVFSSETEARRVWHWIGA